MELVVCRPMRSRCKEDWKIAVIKALAALGKGQATNAVLLSGKRKPVAACRLP
jgi:hypothetical protein